MVSRYLLEKKADDSVLLILIIRIMDALGNYGKVHICIVFCHFALATQILSLLLCFCLCPKSHSYPFIRQIMNLLSCR